MTEHLMVLAAQSRGSHHPHNDLGIGQAPVR